MNKPRVRYMRLFGEYLVHDRAPGEPISSRITIGDDACLEIAYSKFITRLNQKNKVLPLPRDMTFYESVYRRCLNPWRRLKRAFTHKRNGARRFA
ncbi:MAG: hypothetical protein [Caudoviricetes sp.]|nr:MAG: hypothetical protein [Caudoviricetes sp.]